MEKESTLQRAENGDTPPAEGEQNNVVDTAIDATSLSVRESIEPGIEILSFEKWYEINYGDDYGDSGGHISDRMYRRWIYEDYYLK
jgi:hypothetical protein